MRKHSLLFLISLALVFAGHQTYAQIARNFGLAYSSNHRGGIITIGNTVMNALDTPANTPSLVMMNETSNPNNGQGGLGYSQYGNDQSIMKWVDIDGLASTYNSSSAGLALPAGNNTIRFARIYWGGRMPDSSVVANPDTIRTIKLRKGTSGNYTLLTAQEVITIRGSDSLSLTYQAYADISNFIQVNGSGTYTAADIPTTEEDFQGGQYGGWAISLAFENPTFPYFSLRIYDGFAQVYNAGVAGTLPITLSGLNLPNSPLVLQDVILGIVTWEGDANLAGDFIQLNNITVSDSLNPGTNFFNGSISRNNNFVTTKNPNYSNQMGIDIDEFYAGTGYNIQANTSNVNFVFNTTADLYFPGLFTFAIKSDQPVLSIDKTVSDANGSGYADANEILTYTLSGLNMGPDTSYNTFIIDTLPSNLTYVPGSLQVVNALGVTPGPKTDAAGDDQAFVGVAGGKTYIKYHIGNGASASNGGILPPGATSAYTVKFKARTAASPTTVTNLGRIQGQAFNNETYFDDATVTIYLNTSTGINETQVACDSFTWRNSTYTVSGTYTYAYTNSSGAPAVDSLFLTIFNSTSSNNTIAVCPNQLPYIWNGLSFAQAGSQSITLTNAAGCDSTATLNLTVKQNSSSNFNVAVCPNQLPYIWNGLVFTQSGSQTKTLVNAAGCDSLATLNLTVKQNTSSNFNVSVCPNQLPYIWNGLTFTQSGSQTKTLVNAAGCDSLATLNLTVKQNTSSNFNVAVCPNQLPYIWNGLVFTQSGSQTKTLVNAAGCDSLATLNLTVNQNTSSNFNVSVCPSQLPYIWNGLTFTQSGAQSVSLTNAAGCDSTATLNLTVDNISSSSTDTAICANQLPYTWNGIAVTQAGVYSDTLTNSAGCDSVITLNLTVNPVTNSSEDITICSSQLPYTWNGITLTQAGSQSVTLTSVAGCDSIVTLDLTVTPASTSTDYASLCSNLLPYIWNGITINQAGVYSDTLINSAGCDSIASLVFTITPASVTNTVLTICERDLPYVWNGNSYTQSASATISLVNSSGCDSIVILQLTVINCDPPCITENFNASPVGWTLSQGARIHNYSNPSNNCVQDRGIITPGVGGNDPARVRTPLYTSSGAASVRVLFDIYVFDANLRCNSWKNYPCSTSIDVYYYIGNTRYTGVIDYVLPPNGPLNSPTVEVIFPVGTNLPAGVRYSVEIDFKFKSGTGNCVQQNTKYVLDNFSVCEQQCPVCPIAPVYQRAIMTPGIANTEPGRINAPLPELKVWPTPTSGILNLQTLNFIAEKTDVLDLSGRQVRSIPYSAKIDLSTLPPGHYMLRVHSADGVLSKRIWIVR